MNDVNLTQEHDTKKLLEILDTFNTWSLNIEDIYRLEANNNSLAKYLNSYRLSLMVEKATTTGHDTELTAKINILNTIIRELLDGIDGVRKRFQKQQEVTE